MERILTRHSDKWVPEPNTGCYLWIAGVRNKRTNRAAVFVGNRKMAQVARLVCEEAHGPPPTPEHHAAHARPIGCVGALCVAPHHLRWASVSENQMDIPTDVRKARVKHEVVNRGARHEAITNGLNKYFSGKPCSNGHVGLRYARNGQCIECGLLWRKNRRLP